MTKNKFQMTAYTGAVVESAYFGSMIIDLEGIHFADKIPALFQHQADRPAGVITSISKTGTLTAGGYFTSTNDGKMVYDLIKEGYPYQASVGIWADEIEILEKKETAKVNGRTFAGPGAIWRKSHLREISFVSLGRDADTSVSIAASATAATAQPTTSRQLYADVEAQANHLQSQGLTMSEAYTKLHSEQPQLLKKAASLRSKEIRETKQARQTAAMAFHDKAMEIKAREKCSYLEARKIAEVEHSGLFKEAYA